LRRQRRFGRRRGQLGVPRRGHGASVVADRAGVRRRLQVDAAGVDARVAQGRGGRGLGPML
jgi:hypothetical protein